MLSHYTDMNIIGTYLNDDALLEALKHKPADVLLLDIQMQGQMEDEVASILQNLYYNQDSD